MPYYRPFISPVVRSFRKRWLPYAHRGSEVCCPICQQHFGSYVGSPLGGCPGCGAPERSRLLWVFLQKVRPDLLDRSPRVLQIAPDTGLEAQFRAMKGINYLSGDLQEPEAMVKLDLTRLDLPDQTFDLVICLHVLAHISNDRQAMREIFRILRPGGTALIMTPMSQDATTYEDPCLITSEQRDKAYGEWDFVRLYGQDFSARLSEAGFTIEIVQPASEFSAGEMNKIGVWNDKIFVCQRPAE